jgi:HEAT repeats/PBS lyase HEAT-like repeat
MAMPNPLHPHPRWQFALGVLGALLAAVSARDCAHPAAAPAAVLTLVLSLDNGEPEVRQMAARALGRMGPPAKAALPALVVALADGEPSMRWEAAWAMSWIEPDWPKSPTARQAIPRLVLRLHGFAEVDSQAAAAALARIGPSASAAVPRLLQVLDDRDESVRRAAESALDRIDRNWRQRHPREPTERQRPGWPAHPLCPSHCTA